MTVFERQPAFFGKQRRRETRAKSENEPALSQQVLRQDSLNGDVERMMDVQQAHGSAHSDFLGQPRRLNHQKCLHRDRIDPVDAGRLAMMFVDIGIAEPKLAGQNNFPNLFLLGVRRRGMRSEFVRENADIQGAVPF